MIKESVLLIFIEDEAEKLQEEIDKKNAETMGKSETTTGGQSDTEA